MNLKPLNVAVAFAIASTILSGAAFAADKEKQPSLDELLVSAQKICPVSGEDLRAMGGPVKAKVDGQTIFLCCKGCLRKKISKDNWAKVTANLASAQGRCPVMNKPLPKEAKSAVVENRRIFVCCPPCIAKIEASPAKYLALVDEMLAKNVGDPDEE